jgi:4-alpha-glucanotransferase
VPEHCVAYTGTHDNETVLGWWNHQDADARRKALQVLNMKPGDDICDALVRAVLSTRAERAIIPVQDYLALDNEARMNLPGSVGGNNWRYRMQPGDLSDALLHRMNMLNKEYRRTTA